MKNAGFVLLVVSAWVLPPDCNAVDNEQIQTVVESVRAVCLSPSDRGKYWDVEVQGEGEAKINVIKILGKAGVAGEVKFNQGEWEGVQRVLRAQQAADYADYRQCAKQLTPLFLEKIEGAFTNAPPFRVTYYRMSGVAPNFLIKGLLAPEWEQALGGPQTIISNVVLLEAKSFLERFSQDFEGGIFHGEYPPLRRGPNWDINDYARQLTGQPVYDSGRATSDQWKAYLAANQVSYLFIPDIEAAQEVLGSLRWPAGFKIYYPAWAKYDIEKNGHPVPTVWRYLRRSDLTDYYKKIRGYRTLAEQRISDLAIRQVLHSGLPWYTQNEGHLRDYERTDRIVESLLYLTRRSLPEGFMIVEGQQATHGGWLFESQVRNCELEVAVFENISNRPIELGDFEYLELIADDLRYTEETDSALATARRHGRPLHAPHTFLPGEKLIIPLRIHFTFVRPLELLEESVRQVLQQRIVRATEDRIQFFDDRRELLFSKNAESLLNDEPPRFVKRIDFGPAWSLQTVVVNGKTHVVREPDWENFAIFLSSGKGSCPYVFTLQPETGIWLNEGHILLGATAPELARRDTIELRHFNGRVQLRELEAEVAVIRQATLEIVDQRGSTRTLEPTNASLKRGHGVLLAKGEAMELLFPLTNEKRENYRARLTVQGYYIPYSNPDLVRRHGRAAMH